LNFKRELHFEPRRGLEAEESTLVRCEQHLMRGRKPGWLSEILEGSPRREGAGGE
jgi:hypothetical protein